MATTHYVPTSSLSSKPQGEQVELRAEKPQTALRVWLADLTYTQQTIASDAMPTGIGGIATFAESAIEFEKPIRIFKYPEKLAEALERDGIPDIIGFANYVWNARLSYEIAKVIKRRSPKTVVVFGGPNYPVVADE